MRSGICNADKWGSMMDNETVERPGRLHYARMFRVMYYALGTRLLEDLPADMGQQAALTALDTSMHEALQCLEASYKTAPEDKA